jgi:hypothetical protein
MMDDERPLAIASDRMLRLPRLGPTPLGSNILVLRPAAPMGLFFEPHAAFLEPAASTGVDRR